MGDEVYAYLAANRERILGELKEFVSIPSVSTDPAHRPDIDRAAQWVADKLAAAGPFDVRVIPTARHPVVYAEWLGAGVLRKAQEPQESKGRAPTVLVYGHYDVQPPDPLEKWESEPFTPTERGERLYARGISDDKGPMLIPIKVAEAFFAAERRLPINVKFLFEGEEEIGSPSLAAFAEEHATQLACDFVLSADGAMWRIQEPSLTVASRGMAILEFTLYGPGKDLHSGRHGGGLANPLHALAELVASLHTPDGRVAVEGFYDSVRELSADERAEIMGLPFDEAAYLAQVGAPAPFGEPGYNTLVRQWARPTVEVNGLWGGYQGPGSKTVIPSEAHAKLSCRLVPDQDPDDVLQKIERHLQGHLPAGTRLEIASGGHGSKPYRIPANHPGLAAAHAALRSVYGRDPLVVRMGGSVPICEVFRRVLGADTVFFSFSTADEDFHAPNEFFRIHRLWEGLEAWARCWEEIGD